MKDDMHDLQIRRYALALEIAEKKIAIITEERDALQASKQATVAECGKYHRENRDLKSQLEAKEREIQRFMLKNIELESRLEVSREAVQRGIDDERSALVMREEGK